MFRLFKKKTIPIYCQYLYCKRELTNIGGFVADNGKIYCHHGFDAPKKCSTGCMHENTIYHDWERMYACDEDSRTTFLADYKNPEEVQEAVRKGKLTHFGILERTASTN